MRFEDLDVWKRAARLSIEIYQAMEGLKDRGFKDQITRSGLSIASNIAEGYEREGSREAANFLNYAKGSAGELRTQIYIAMRIGYLRPETGRKWIREAEEISKMLFGLMKSLQTTDTR